MFKKIIFSFILTIFLFPQNLIAENKSNLSPCRQAWGDKMKEYDDAYVFGLNNLLFQKTSTEAILDSETISYNLRAHNCNMSQTCEAVRRSLFPEEETQSAKMIIGNPLRCQAKPISEFSNITEQCTNVKIDSQKDTHALWAECVESAETRISNIELITETEIVKSSSAKKTSNLVKYLIELNAKMDKLSMDTGDMIGTLFDVTRKMACVQKSCH